MPESGFKNPSHSPQPSAQGSLPASSEYLDDLFRQWKQDPASVGRDWQSFFLGFEMGLCRDGSELADAEKAQSRVDRLIEAYRQMGHLAARVDPLGEQPEAPIFLKPERFNLSQEDLAQVFANGIIGAPGRSSLAEIIQHLEEIYCRTLGVEYLHNPDLEIRRWLQSEMEPRRNKPDFDRRQKLEILSNLVDAEVFETFIQKRHPGQKRFSLEGGESLIPALHFLMEAAGGLGVQEVVMGMAHRGRLNVLANILNKPYSKIFFEFQDIADPTWVDGDGDVKYHRGFSSTHTTSSGAQVKISLTDNPSHLEAVDPVVEGRVRAKQRRLQDTQQRSKVVPLLIHGDAAFAGQGLVAETFNLSQLPGYRTGGTVHIVVNNQIGFTTSPDEARSTHYSTDVAKLVGAPVFHVNGDDPEMVVYAVQKALRFRQEFSMDVVVDLVCYRRHGHNEADEPAFTHPHLYKKIRNRPSVRQLYTQELVECCELSEKEAKRIADGFRDKLEKAFESAKQGRPGEIQAAFEDVWEGLDKPYSHQPAETRVGQEQLLQVAQALTTVPDGFQLNPKIKRSLPQRLEAVEKQGNIDWAYAELLAFGSLLQDGFPVRLSGQDSARGTFSQRHAMWQDMESEKPYVPLRSLLKDDQATFCLYNSMLSEAAVLGFDYGYSLAEPNMLLIWEAQFGDFANGAQVIIDQFITTSQSKWQRTSGLVMLLPHGYEGQGPEHSNAYLDRYLAACAEGNLQVCNLTTPANYFHALRRQLKRPFRRPLIVMAPKSLLRHKRCLSPLDEFSSGRFQEVLDDPDGPDGAHRLVLCSGKVFYDLAERREELGRRDVALLRIEQFYPFPLQLLGSLAGRYGQAREVVWVQEEPRNRGGWAFMHSRLQSLFPGLPLRYIGRAASASSATGSLAVHKKEQEALVSAVFAKAAESRSAAPQGKRRAAEELI